MLKWHKFKIVEHMQKIIEENLREHLTLSKITEGTGYSMFYAQRIFIEITGNTPFEYLRKRRLSAASEMLMEENIRVIDTALEFVFDSHEGFTRAFSRQFGMTPSEFMKNKPALTLFMPDFMRDFDPYNMKGTEHMEKQTIQTVFTQIIERPRRKLVIRRGQNAEHYFSYCEEMGCDITDVLGTIESAITEPMGLWLPSALITPGTSKYVMGIEVPMEFSGALPDSYELLTLKPCTYMIFQGPPFKDKDFEEAIQSVWNAISEYNPGNVGYCWDDESAPRFQLSPMGYRGYIEGRAVKKIEKSPSIFAK